MSVRRIAVALTALALAAGVPPAAAGAHEQSWSGGAVVQTGNGAVRGISRTRYDAWLGIPYAAPPVGDLRWQAPQPAARWSGVRDATRFGAAASRAAAGTRATSSPRPPRTACT